MTGTEPTQWSETTREAAQSILRSFASFNDGHGLIVSRSLSKALRDNGITEPYLVQQDLPAA